MADYIYKKYSTQAAQYYRNFIFKAIDPEIKEVAVSVSEKDDWLAVDVEKEVQFKPKPNFGDKLK